MKKLTKLLLAPMACCVLSSFACAEEISHKFSENKPSATVSISKVSPSQSIVSGFVVQEKKEVTCHILFQHKFEHFFRLLKAFGIEIDWDIKLCGKFKWKPEEVKEKLSLLEEQLVQHGQMVPEIKAELTALLRDVRSR